MFDFGQFRFTIEILIKVMLEECLNLTKNDSKNHQN